MPTDLETTPTLAAAEMAHALASQPAEPAARSCLELAPATLATCFSTLFAIQWPFQHIRFDEAKYIDGEEQLDGQLVGLELEHVLFVWVYTIIFFLLQDVCKVGCYRVLYHFDVCGIKTQALANAERVAKNRALQGGPGHGAAHPTSVTRPLEPA